MRRPKEKEELPLSSSEDESEPIVQKKKRGNNGSKEKKKVESPRVVVQEQLSDTVPKNKATVITALAFEDKTRPKDMRVVFGSVGSDGILVASSELNDKNIVTALDNEKFNIAELLANNTFIKQTTVTHQPEMGAVWQPSFAKNFLIYRQANAASARIQSDNQQVDVGELIDMGARHSLSDFAQETLNASSRHSVAPVPAAALNGAQLVSLLSNSAIPAAQRPELINQALVKSTVQEHNRMLTKLLDLPETLHHMPIPIALATFLWDQSVELQWKPTTLFKYLCTAQGALRILHLYRNSAPSVMLSNDASWAMIMRGARQLAVEHIPLQPKAATIDAINKALRATSGTFTKHVRVIIMLAWLTTSRLGCIRKLKTEDFNFNETERTMDITFRRGKGVRARQQAYTVTTLIVSTEWWREITTYIKARSGFLFPLTLKDKFITDPLKVAGIEQRSIRRGALQAMAADHVTPAVLMNFSGHTSEKTLNRYLDFGKKRADLASASKAAARSLWNETLLDSAWLEDSEADETQGPQITLSS